MTAGLPPGLTLTPAGVISGTPTTPGTYDFTVVGTDNVGNAATKAYTIAINAPAPLNITAPAGLANGVVGSAFPSRQCAGTGGVGPYSWSAVGLPPGVQCSASGSITGTPTAAGSYTPTITMRDSQGATVSQGYTTTIAPAPVAVHITGPATIPGGTVGRVWPAQTITAAAGSSPYTWSATGLPPGLTINAVTGRISGTPTVAANYTAVITVTDAGAVTDTISYDLTIIDQLTVNGPSSVPNGIVGSAFTPTAFTAAGGTQPLSWASSGLPPGLTLTTTLPFYAGFLSGTPTQAGTFVLLVTVTDQSGQIATRAYTVAILPALTITSPASLPDGTAKQNYGPVIIVAAGGTGPYTFSATGLPPGVSIVTFGAGLVVGVVSAPGSYNVTITVTDALGRTASRQYGLLVKGGKPPGRQTLAGARFRLLGKRTGGQFV